MTTGFVLGMEISRWRVAPDVLSILRWFGAVPNGCFNSIAFCANGDLEDGTTRQGDGMLLST